MANFDDTAVVTIHRVGPKSASGRYYITDSLGRKFGTTNPLVASLAERYRVKQIPCTPISYAGCFFRDLVGLDAVVEVHAS